jgi:hypothetical protein
MKSVREFGEDDIPRRHGFAARRPGLSGGGAQPGGENGASIKENGFRARIGQPPREMVFPAADRAGASLPGEGSSTTIVVQRFAVAPECGPRPASSAGAPLLRGGYHDDAPSSP